MPTHHVHCIRYVGHERPGGSTARGDHQRMITNPVIWRSPQRADLLWDETMSLGLVKWKCVNGNDFDTSMGAELCGESGVPRLGREVSSE